MKTRFIHIISHKIRVVATSDNCPNKKWGYHWGEKILQEGPDIDFNTFDCDFKKYKGTEFICKHCDQPFTSADSVSFGKAPIYNTVSGDVEPGCMYWNEWYPADTFWDNQTGPHLMVQLPNGSDWCIDSRASNCTLLQDRMHRCWHRIGNPEQADVTVDKGGNTCAAGGGSIMMSGWHGFLRGGELIEC